MKIYLLHALDPNSDIFDDPESAKLYVIRAPDEAIAREQPKREDSWTFNGGKSPWMDSEQTKCVELAEVELPLNGKSGQKFTPEEYTKILYRLA